MKDITESEYERRKNAVLQDVKEWLHRMDIDLPDNVVEFLVNVEMVKNYYIIRGEQDAKR